MSEGWFCLYLAVSYKCAVFTPCFDPLEYGIVILLPEKRPLNDLFELASMLGKKQIVRAPF